MPDREKILRFFRGNENEELVSKLLDLADGANKIHKYRVSSFLDPCGLQVAEIIVANYGNLKIETSGGFFNAERQKIAFVFDEYQGKLDFAIGCLFLRWDKRYYDVTHRDILGAFIGLGCKREMLGDIAFVPDGAQIVVDSNLCDFLINNFKSVGRAAINVKQINQDDLSLKEERAKIVCATVADLRLDAVAAAGYGISRSRMADEIRSQSVKLNWQVAKKASQMVEQGDIISFRGRGRVEITEVRGVTKKGRISIILKRLM